MALVAALCALATSLPASAEARPYVVFACDAATYWGYANNAWSAIGQGTIESRCPSNNDDQRGMTTRMVGGAFAGFAHSIYHFDAPPGTTITALKWSGRMARNNCNWRTTISANPGDHRLIGLLNGQQCSIPSLDVGLSHLTLTPPVGTTSLRQMVLCSAPFCEPGATFHSRHMEVHLDDYWVPWVGATGALAEGQWVRGDQLVRVDAGDNTGVQRVDASLGSQTRLPGVPLQPDLPDALPVTRRSRPRPSATAALPDGEHTLTVTATTPPATGLDPKRGPRRQHAT